MASAHAQLRQTNDPSQAGTGPFGKAARALRLAAWVSLAVFSLCDAPVVASQGTAPAWPPPPAEPYVVYVRTIAHPSDIGVKPAALRRFATWLTGSSTEDAGLVKPFGLAVDDSGGLLVTDTGANAVCFLDPARKTWLRWDSIGKTRLQSPVAVARCRETFFVADSALGKVFAFDRKGKPQFEITRELERPSGLACSGDQLFVADSQLHKVVIFNARGGFVSAFGRRGSGPGEFNFPTHLTVDSAGQVYVTDSLNCRIQVFDALGKFRQAIGSVGDGPGHFSRPKGVAVDSSGHVYVIDGVFDNVQTFDREGRLLLHWGETGSDPGQFWLPNAIAIRRDNEIYVADSYNHRIQVFRYTGKP